MTAKPLIALLASAAFCAGAAAEEVTYRNDIRPLIAERCGKCHGATAPELAEFLREPDKYKKDKLGPRLDSYGSLVALVGWPDTGALMRRLDDGASVPDGKAGNMYAYLGGSDEEKKARLARIKAWVGEDAWKLNRWNARGDVPAITKEQLDKLKLKY